MPNVLYEVTYRFHDHYLIPFVVFVGFFLFFVKEIKAIRQAGSCKGHMIQLCLLSPALLIIAAVCVIMVTTQIHQYEDIVVAYRQGQYETVEGPVENFVPMPAEGHAQETFEIDGVAFEYSGYSTAQGYNTPKVSGGVITGDGQQLRIGYIYSASEYRNVIVYIAELPTN